jgi:hypothetical protein
VQLGREGEITLFGLDDDKSSVSWPFSLLKDIGLEQQCHVLATDERVFP